MEGGEGGWWGWDDVNSILNTCFFPFNYCSLLGDFCTENIIKENKQTNKKEVSSTEQASNEAVAKNSWRYHFANPYIYIYIYIYNDQ